ncbi:Hypothetical predicted protein [Lecanosticta acicola]|uniref:Bacteriophage T5 Orf172 DNA-binding domain-containing protein n=1 Tax=Lecanosticta acicola TaxID=111012 RepID=A0AAI8YZ49_9PEZI|nr:Hypothetical predicted protein [Lecanosticta acicola]
MADSPQTPEALLGRNDSKNPCSTCKGITNSGRPCRRALAGVPRSNDKRSSLASALSGVVAVVEEDGRVQEADFYCWQHKDQAREVVQQENGRAKTARRKRSAELFPLQERSSIDTLVERLGINGKVHRGKNNGKTNDGVKPPRHTETIDFMDVDQRPRPSSGRLENDENCNHRPERRNTGERPGKKKPGFWASLCCATNDDDDYVEIIRHRKRTEQQRPSQTHNIGTPSSDRPPRAQHESRPQSTSVPPRKPISSGNRMSSQQRSSSNHQTGHLLSLIPQHCSPQTTSTLLAELIKPISSADEEGYIYIFWLTPQAREAPAESTARSLLSPPDRRPEQSRRISDVMTEFSYNGTDDEPTRSLDGNSKKGKKTIMLKIGRANNVTRRMNEWQRQCGYKLNLVRWYPYVSSSGTPSPQRESGPSSPRRQSNIVQKVPCVKRVERLIHLELAGKRVLRDCETCGKEHREWFQVEASQEGIRGVDECVKRWVEWAERQVGA